MIASNLPSDAPVDRLSQHDDLPAIPDTWSRVEPDELTHAFDPTVAWVNDLTGQAVTIESTRRPTQMHTPESSTDDTGYCARVYEPTGPRNRSLSRELGGRDEAWAAAIRFMAKYDTGEYDLPERPAYDGPEDW